MCTIKSKSYLITPIFRRRIYQSECLKMVITQPVINVFSWNFRHCMQHTQSYPYMLKLNFYEKSQMVPFLIAGHNYGLYYLPSVQYFSRHHFPYAMLALIVLTIFVGIPTMVLVLYPLRFFKGHMSGLILVIICIVSACVPLLYIAFFVFSWLIKIKRQSETKISSCIIQSLALAITVLKDQRYHMLMSG